MPDRESVIKGLEICEKKDCVLCPYKDEKDETYSGFCEQVLKQDALALLKEQETANIYKCPYCGTWISAENVVRCKECKHGEPSVDIDGDPCIHCRNRLTGIGKMLNIPPEWFCAYGERR